MRRRRKKVLSRGNSMSGELAGGAASAEPISRETQAEEAMQETGL